LLNQWLTFIVGLILFVNGWFKAVLIDIATYSAVLTRYAYVYNLYFVSY